MNDTHANLYEHDDVLYSADGFKLETMGGYPRLMTKVKAYRQAYPGEVLLFDNGDTLHGTKEAVDTKGEVMIPYLKALAIDAMTFHWDSAYTPKHLKSMEDKLGYPILACNVYKRGTKDYYFKASQIIEKNGLRVGVIGLASNIIQRNMPPKFSEGADFTDGIEETKVEVSKLKAEGVDLIVLLSHLGYPQDIALLKQVDGIDLCLSGHTHNRVKTPQKFNGAYIIQSGSLTSSMGMLRLEVDKGIKKLEHEFIYLDQTIEQDPQMLDMFEQDKILQAYKKDLDVKVGESKIDLHRGSSFYGTMDYLLLEAIQEASGLDIAFSNGWRYGGAIKKGDLSRRDLYAIVPMDPEIQTAKLTGQELFDLLEDNLESTFSTQAFKQMGGYIKRNVGLRIFFKLENPYGQRIQQVFVGDQRLQLDKSYEVAYVTPQAVPANVGSDHRSTGLYTIDAMEKLLAKRAYVRQDFDSYIPV